VEDDDEDVEEGGDERKDERARLLVAAQRVERLALGTAGQQVELIHEDATCQQHAECRGDGRTPQDEAHEHHTRRCARHVSDWLRRSARHAARQAPGIA
jgi:hypothetical protein